MRDLIQVIPDDMSKNKLIVHESLIQRKVTYLRFGQRCFEVEVCVSDDINKDEILLSTNVIEALRLPLEPLYDCKITSYEVNLGPYIGLLAYRKLDNLHENVSILSNYLYDYSEIGGAVVAFTADSVDQDSQRIEGYVYDPHEKKWEHGLFGYPSVIFKRAGMSRRLRNHFHSIIGHRIFNSYIFDKWEMYEWLSEFSSTSGYLPETILYEEPQDVTSFLDMYSEAFIKPIAGSQGVGIMRAEKKDSHYIFHFREDSQKRKEVCSSEKEAKAFIKNTCKQKRFIVQSAIRMLKSQDRVIDFRMLLVKDERGYWQDSNLITRYGTKGNYVSNISDGGNAELAVDTFRHLLAMPEEKLYQLRKKISEVGITAAKNLEKQGIHLGNLGIDIAIDEDMNIWIIEINNKDPNHTISNDAKDRQTFYAVKRSNMLYAKYLAGFGKE